MAGWESSNLTSAGDAFPSDDCRAAPGSAVGSIPVVISGIALDVQSPLPLHEQICQAIRAAIWSGDLPPKTLLPPSRDLAQHLGVSRNTVVFAYSHLVAEGLCVSNTRRGTRVAADLLQRSNLAYDTGRPDATKESPRVAYHTQDSMRWQVDRTQSGSPFAICAHDPVHYPRTKLGRRIAEKFLSSPSIQLKSGQLAQFQSVIASYLRQARGVVCAPSQIIAVTGLEAALDLVARVLIDPGDTVAIEDPSADFVHSVFRTVKASIRAIPSDTYGADPGRMLGPPARLIYVSPSVSFPFGVAMPSARRHEVLSAARAQNAVVIENDSLFELRYSGASQYAIQAQDLDGRVIYFGGLSDVLGDSMRVAYLVVPESLLDAFREASFRSSATPPAQVQEALAEFIETHEFSMHARMVRAAYSRRLEVARGACGACLGTFRTSEPTGGLHLVIYVDCPDRDVQICELAAREGIPVRPLSRYFVQDVGVGGLVYSFGAVNERVIPAMIKRLAEICALDRTKIAG